MVRDVYAATRVDRDPRVVEDTVLEVALLREHSVDQARHTDGAVVVAQGHDAVGERRLARVGQRGRPAVPAPTQPAEPEGERAELRRGRGNTALAAVGAKHGEHERPVDACGP